MLTCTVRVSDSDTRVPVSDNNNIWAHFHHSLSQARAATRSECLMELEANPLAAQATSPPPPAKETRQGISNTTFRYAIEAWVCIGTVCGVVVQIQATERGKYSDMVVGVPFFSITIPFALLCWNNIDWMVMKLLMKQAQFKMLSS